MKRVDQLLQIGDMCATDAESFLKLRGFFENLEANPSPQGAKFLEAFELVHRCFTLVTK